MDSHKTNDLAEEEISMDEEVENEKEGITVRELRRVLERHGWFSASKSVGGNVILKHASHQGRIVLNYRDREIVSRGILKAVLRNANLNESFTKSKIKK